MEKWFFSPQEAGTDEAGRGCLAGPVTAAAVILPEDFYHPLLNDSKQMTEKQRNLLRPIIEEQALSYAVVQSSPLSELTRLISSTLLLRLCIRLWIS